LGGVLRPENRQGHYVRWARTRNRFTSSTSSKSANC
jgi:hypothetical protein